MKKLVNIILAGAVAVLIFPVSSCTKKIDEAFANPNALTKQPIDQILPGVEAGMATFYSANGTGYGVQNDLQFIGRFVQYWATNSTGSQYDQMGDNFINKSDNLGSIWAMLYYGMGQNVASIIKWGSEENKWDYVGVAQAIRAWGFLTATDIHDDIILKEAFRPDLLVFKYDPQPDVYAEVLSLCDQALENFNKATAPSAGFAQADFYLNGGDLNKWRKFCYAVKAKVFNRYTNKSSLYQPDSVVKYCDLAQQTNADNSSLRWSNAGSTGTYSYWSPFRGNVGTLRQTKFIADLMQGVNTQFPTGEIDPRAYYIIRENNNGTFKGTRPNKGTDGLATNDQPLSFWGLSFGTTTSPSSDNGCRYLFRNAPVFPFITASEIQFLKAEALYRKGDKAGARAAYLKGIQLNFEQLRSDYETNVPVANKITDSRRDSYLANPIVVPAAANLTLSHIMMQKYIAMYGWGGVETWVDIRRFHYTDLDPATGQQVYREFAPPTGIDLYPNNFGKWIYRHRPRYNSEYLYNIDELNRVGAFAPDYITKECWFSKP